HFFPIPIRFIRLKLVLNPQTLLRKRPADPSRTQISRAPEKGGKFPNRY
ncbi:MAG: hypothetical protein ACI97B_004458, partial [Verrucomicrobiales bacterium]